LQTFKGVFVILRKELCNFHTFVLTELDYQKITKLVFFSFCIYKNYKIQKITKVICLRIAKFVYFCSNFIVETIWVFLFKNIGSLFSLTF